MRSLGIEIPTAIAERVIVTKDNLMVALTDGRTVSAPLAWYPRLLHGTPLERKKWRLIGGGEGIHWPDLDEDISVEHLVLGKPSGESQRSLKEWLEKRKAQQRKVLKKNARPQITQTPRSRATHTSRARHARGASASARRKT
jgi:hypothetical protein